MPARAAVLFATAIVDRPAARGRPHDDQAADDQCSAETPSSHYLSQYAFHLALASSKAPGWAILVPLLVPSDVIVTVAYDGNPASSPDT
ncbi:hypothetical protein GCM10029978_026190 [Actinoallomurus acanthiterrae]